MNKTTVVIIHGSFGDINENWIPYLKENLDPSQFDVIIPQFPVDNGQNLDSWTSTFKETVGDIKENMILVGHSIAPAFILSLLENSSKKAKGIIFVSGFLHDLGDKDFDRVNHTFTHSHFNWEKIRENFEDGFSFHGNDDPYVPAWMGEEIAKNLNIDLMLIEDGGHLNIAAGFKEFPALLEKVKEFA